MTEEYNPGYGSSYEEEEYNPYASSAGALPLEDTHHHAYKHQSYDFGHELDNVYYSHSNSSASKPNDGQSKTGGGRGTSTGAHHQGGPRASPVLRSHRDADEGKLFIGGLSWETTDEELKRYFGRYGKLTDSVVMKDSSGKSRGFAFVTYESPENIDAVMAEPHHVLSNKRVDPKPAIPREAQVKAEKMFVGAIPLEVTEDELRDHFAPYGSIIDTTLMVEQESGKSRGFGFVTFESEDGLTAALAAEPHVLGGVGVETKKALPKSNSKPSGKNKRDRDRGRDRDRDEDESSGHGRRRERHQGDRLAAAPYYPASSDVHPLSTSAHPLPASAHPYYYPGQYDYGYAYGSGHPYYPPPQYPPPAHSYYNEGAIEGRPPLYEPDREKGATSDVKSSAHYPYPPPHHHYPYPSQPPPGYPPSAPIPSGDYPPPSHYQPYPSPPGPYTGPGASYYPPAMGQAPPQSSSGRYSSGPSASSRHHDRRDKDYHPYGGARRK